MRSGSVSDYVHDPARLCALYSVALLDTPSEEAFDRLSRLAVRLLDVPIALVSLVDADRQFFKSCVGMETEPWASGRQTPLSHSFCQHNRYVGQALAVEDARTHPVFKDNLAIRDLDVVAYLGFPLATSDGYVLGSFCAIDNKPRQWNDDDIAVIADLAASVMVEIQLRTEVATRHQVEGELDLLTDLNSQLRSQISARKQAEDQQRSLQAQLQHRNKLEAVGQLAGGIAHDMNNLLAPILIYTSILLDGSELATSHHDIVGQIQSAALRSRNLIRQLLAFSRMQPMEQQLHTIDEIVDDMESLLRRTIPEDITMTVDLLVDRLPILADATQVEQILMNLVVNAADAMPAGGDLHIETSTTMLDAAQLVQNQEAAPGLYTTLAIRDTGAGMTQETLERLFEPFFSTKGMLGTGLGLSTVMGIVMQHGGVVQCDSKLGEGSEFLVHFPLATNSVDGAHHVDDEPVAGHGDSVRSETIVLVEDDAQVRGVSRMVLVKQGFTVIVATDGADALEQMAEFEGQIDLLVTDVVMPGINGRVLYEHARKTRPDLPVLYMSGHSQDILLDCGVAESGIGFVAKPFLATELVTKIDALLLPG